PWQHVLEPLAGYMKLGAMMLQHPRATEYCDAFNFGPNVTSNRNVRELVEEVIQCWSDGSWHHLKNDRANHETSLLHVSSDKAFHKLGWYPKWEFKETIATTIEWYKAAQTMDDHRQLVDLTLNQIKKYEDGPQKLHKEKAMAN